MAVAEKMCELARLVPLTTLAVDCARRSCGYVDRVRIHESTVARLHQSIRMDEAQETMAGGEQRVRANEEQVAAKVIDGEAILINLSSGMYYSMGATGGLIWALIEQGASVDEIAVLIADRLGEEIETVTADVTALVSELLSEELVIPGSPATGFSGQLPIGTEFPSAYTPPKLEKFSDMAEMFALDPPLPGLADAHGAGKADASPAEVGY